MKKNLQFVEIDNLVKTPIDICIKFAGLIDFSFFINVGGEKKVEIQHDKHNLPQVFAKYKEKGVKQLLVRQHHYDKFVKALRVEVDKKLSDPSFQAKQKMQALYEGFHQLKNHLLQFGFQKSGFNLANDISKQAMNNMKSSNELYDMFKQFRDDSSDRFVENTFIGYLCTMMISTFEWQTPTIKEKVNIAVLLSDISLLDKDFEELEVFMKNSKHDLDFLSNRIKNHPTQIASMLKAKGLISSEVAMIIEQHHERPDDTAFPRQVRFAQIGLLSAIHIVSRHFMELVYKNDFDESKKLDILKELNVLYKNKNFLLAFRSLVKCLRMEGEI